jgi:hypothetical protein
LQSTAKNQSALALLSHRVAIGGLLIYAVFAPHSVAASTIGIVVAVVSWLIKSIAIGTLGVRRSKFDLIILLSLLWTVASSLLSTEPEISIPKLTALWSVLLFYLSRALVNRRTALVLVSVLILSGVTGVLYSAYDLLRGRGIVVESVTSGSPLRQVDIRPGDAIWRFAGKRVYSVAELDEEIKSARLNDR